MKRAKSSERVLVEDCDVISVGRISQLTNLPNLPWESTSAELTAECQHCRHIWRKPVQLFKTRQGLRFACPKCQRKIQKLYLPPGVAKDDWACQRCHGLGYAVQYRKSLEEVQLRALEKLHAHTRGAL